MNRFSKISFDQNLTFIPNSELTIDELIEADHVDEDDENFEEEEEEEEEDDEETEEMYYEEKCDDEIFIDENDNVIGISNRSELREFQEQTCMQDPFVKIGALTLPSLKETDIPTIENPTNPCSICLQRNCNTVILPCIDKEFCLTCVHEICMERFQQGLPFMCPTCCGPISNVIRL